MQLKLLIFCIALHVESSLILALDCQDKQSLLNVSYIASDSIIAHQDNIQGRKNPYWYLINVLPGDIFNECFIHGSINIPVHKLEKKLANSKKWPRDCKIVVYCAGGDCPLSKYAYEILEKLGFDDIQILAGGITEWVANNLQVHGSCAFKCFN